MKIESGAIPPPLRSPETGACHFKPRLRQFLRVHLTETVVFESAIVERKNSSFFPGL